MNKSGLKALILLGATLPLASVGGQAAGLAPGQRTIDATEHVLGAVAGGPAVLAQQAPPPASSAAPEPARETRKLEEALTDLSTTDPEAIDDLRTEFDDAVDDIEADLDDLEDDLDDQDAELDELGDTNGVEGSLALQRAENKLRELEDRVRGLRRQLSEIRAGALRSDDPAAFIGQVRSLGAGIAAIKQAERAELVPLIEAAERRERDDDEDEDEEEEADASPEPSPTAEP